MKKQKLILLIIFILIMNLNINTYADTDNIKKSTINIKINEQKITTESIIYDNIKYIPLNKLEEILDKKITWDKKEKIFEFKTINKKNENNDNENYNQLKGLNKENPVSLNETMNFTLTSNSDGTSTDMTMKTLEIIRGDKAWNMIYSANKFNKAPKNNYEYMLVKFYFKLNYMEKEGMYDLSPYHFDLISNGGKKYKLAGGVLPEPEFDSDLFEGGEHEGWVAFQVKKDDVKPIIAYKLNNDGTCGIWFEGYVNNNNFDNNKNDSNKTQIDNVDSKNEIYSYLNDNYKKLKTSIGMTYFDFDIIKNDSILFPYDYEIHIKYSPKFILRLQDSIEINEDTRNEVKDELKKFQEKIGKDLIQKYPNKKLTGCYYYSFYKYPTLKMDLITFRYFTWTNYNEIDFLKDENFYNQTKASLFRWYPLIDKKL